MRKPATAAPTSLRVDRLARIDEPRDPPRLGELGVTSRSSPSAATSSSSIGKPRARSISSISRSSSGSASRRGVDDERLEALPRRLPLVQIEPGFLHDPVPAPTGQAPNTTGGGTRVAAR